MKANNDKRTKFEPILYVKCPKCGYLTLESNGQEIHCKSSTGCSFGWKTHSTKKDIRMQRGAIWIPRGLNN